jgi:Helix-turn-helix domain
MSNKPIWGAIPRDLISQLTDRELRVYSALATYVNRWGEGFATHHDLAQVAGRCEKTVRNGLADLERRGLIDWKTGRQGRANAYRILEHPLSQSVKSEPQPVRAVTSSVGTLSYQPAEPIQTLYSREGHKSSPSVGGSNGKYTGTTTAPLAESTLAAGFTSEAQHEAALASQKRFEAQLRDQAATNGNHSPLADQDSERERLQAEWLQAFRLKYNREPACDFSRWAASEFAEEIQEGMPTPW